MLPERFVYLKDIAPDIVCDIRYATNNNFVGRIIDGYKSNVAVTTDAVAFKLKAVQEELARFGLGLKVFDAYRPQSASRHFYRWASDVNDVLNKDMYYPSFDNKLDLFNGFIAKYSAHTRGSAVDLTIIEKASGDELDMGGIFDFFGPISSTDADAVGFQGRANRALLFSVMHNHGFVNYHKEWWHYQLKEEVFPNEEHYYFDFEVR